MFLKEIQKSKLRKIRIKQLLLLIIRILIVVFLVFAFANPVYKGYHFNKNPDIRKCGIFILDNSFSMSAKDGNGVYYEQAKNSVQNILKLYNNNDKVFLITSSHLNNFEKGEFADFQSLLDSLKNLDFTCIPFNQSELFNYVKSICDNNSFPQYEIFVLSDFQKINFKPEFIDNKLFDEIGKKINIYNVNIGQREASNISVDRVEFISKILEYNRDIKISVILKNHNKFNAINKQANLYINGSKVSEIVTDIASFERKEVSFSFKPDKLGSSSGFVELIQNDYFDDEIKYDNKIYFDFYIPEQINVGLVGDNENDLKYIKLALESSEKLNENTFEKKFYKILESGNISTIAGSSDMMIISGKYGFSNEDVKSITGNVKKGKGVLIFPGRNIDIKSYNELFGSLSSFRIGEVLKVNKDTGVYRKFDNIDFEHPVFSGVFKNENINFTKEKNFIESPDINFLYSIIPGNNCVKIMTLPESELFLTESSLGEGKIIFCAVSASDDMSDFSKKSIFPLIINKCVFYLSKNFYENQNLLVGKNNLVKTSNGKVYLIPYNQTYRDPGIYSILDSTNNSKYFFSINRDTLESNLQKSTSDEIKKYYDSFNLNNVAYIENQAELNSKVIESRNGIELWKYLIGLALILVLVEMIYSKKLEKL